MKLSGKLKYKTQCSKRQYKTYTKNSTIAKRWVREKDWELEYAVAILEEFKLGLVDK